MSDRLPYEEQIAQQWNDLPLPDENMAWEDMKRRLEEDDKNRIIPPFWLSGCGLWGLIALLVIGLGWFIVRPEKWWNKKEKTGSSQNIIQNKDNNNKPTQPDASVDTPVKTNSDENSPDKALDQVPNNNIPGTSQTDQRPQVDKSTTQQRATVDPATTTIVQPGRTGNRRTSSQTPGRSQNRRQGRQPTTAPVNPAINNNPNNVPRNTDPSKPIDTRGTTGDSALFAIQPGAKGSRPNKDSAVINDSTSLADGNTSKTDSTKKAAKDSLAKKTTEQLAKTNDPKKDSSQKKSFSFGAGLGMFQLIPIDGQTLTPYSSSGRKSSLSDYIPSVYFRMYREKNNVKKWFAQAEFRYGAPQYNGDFLYSEQNDTSAGYTFTTSTTLKKTFYHQLPVSFNYFITKDWSIGAGFVWNRFTSAISEQDVVRTDNQTQQDSIITNKGVVVTSNSSDSLSTFAKSYFQGVFETQYRWKRFSFGARYSFGLQPYIKFSLPGGGEQEERNKSFQIFIRYELWQSKKGK